MNFLVVPPRGSPYTLVRTARSKRKMRQFEVAEMAGISAGFLSRLENRKGKLTRRVALRLAKALKCTAKSLLDDARETA